jgi:hypothetical protein
MKTITLEKINELGEKRTHWVFICKKLEGADQHCEENWDSVRNKITLEMEI